MTRGSAVLSWYEEVAMIARDIMTRTVHTISPEATVQDVAQLLSQKSMSGVPVIDKEGKIIGIVTESDIIGKVHRAGLCVADIMSPEIIFVDEETRVGEIAMLLVERNIKRVPVMREGQLLGIICRADIVHAVAQGHLIIRHW